MQNVASQILIAVVMKVPGVCDITTCKVKLSLCLIKHYDMKTCGEWQYTSTILDLYLEVSGQLHTPAHLHREKVHFSHWIGGYVGPQNRSGRREKEVNLAPIEIRTPTPRPSSQ
jgi:hypothetical protein